MIFTKFFTKNENKIKVQPIGVFDSGLGGISIWKELVKLMPSESTIYYADSWNCPYGAKSHDEIRALSERITRFLLQKNCKMVVVACNTATAAAIDYLRSQFEVPFIGIEPAVKPAAQHTKTGAIGILATKGTFEGELFQQTKKRYANHLEVVMQVGTGLVEIVENGLIDTPEALVLVEQYIRPMMASNVDQIVLGCTHYPFLEELINSVTVGKVTIINPAPAVALQAKRRLERNALLAPADTAVIHTFFTSGNKRILADFLKTHTNLTFEISHDIRQ